MSQQIGIKREDHTISSIEISLSSETFDFINANSWTSKKGITFCVGNGYTTPHFDSRQVILTTKCCRSKRFTLNNCPKEILPDLIDSLKELQTTMNDNEQTLFTGMQTFDDVEKVVVSKRCHVGYVVLDDSKVCKLSVYIPACIYDEQRNEIKMSNGLVLEFGSGRQSSISNERIVFGQWFYSDFCDITIANMNLPVINGKIRECDADRIVEALEEFAQKNRKKTKNGQDSDAKWL